MCTIIIIISIVIIIIIIIIIIIYAGPRRVIRVAATDYQRQQKAKQPER